jgi:hypothetical protein
MQTLGVSGEPKQRDEGRLKSLFWPKIENAWDAETINRQGFWVCLIIAVYQVIHGVVVSTVSPSIAAAVAVFLIELTGGLIFFIGGMGVRESSWPAATLVLGLFSLNLLYPLAINHFPGVLAIVAEGLLLATLRASLIASRLPKPAAGEDRRMRFNQTFAYRLADQWPTAAWPVLRIPFFILGILLLLLSVSGTLIIFLVRLGILPNPTAS